MTTAQLIRRDSKRHIGEEMLQGIRDIKAGETGRTFRVEVTKDTKARIKLELSRGEFAERLGVSVRSLLDWEQGRR